MTIFMSSCRTVDFKNEEVKRCLMKVQLDLLRLFQSLRNRFVGQNSHVFIVDIYYIYILQLGSKRIHSIVVRL